MKPGRNDPCHCGSGQKYKKCCSTKDDAAFSAELAAQAAARAAAQAAEAEAKAEEGGANKEGAAGAKAAPVRPGGAAAKPPKPRNVPPPPPRKHAI